MRFFPIVLLLGLTAGSLSAQTTGVPGINDYTINGQDSGSTSCTQVAIGGSIVSNFNISTSSGTPVLFMFSLCPCSPGNQCVPTPTCTFLPMTACGGLSNQSLDLVPTCILTSQFAISDGIGNANMNLFIPYGLTFSTQAFVLDPTGGGCAAPTFPGTFTQAYNVVTVPV